MDVAVRDAGRKGKGVFATRPFESGEMILPAFEGRVIDRAGLARLSSWEREHLSEFGIGLWRVLPVPRCYLNHSCDPNAMGTEGDAILASRDIARDEEITIDYRWNSYDDGTGVWVMECLCDPARGPHQVVGDFFALPPAVQESYVEFAPRFIKELYLRRQRP